jgi:exodeoxyribonuclease VII large subunit
MNADLPPDHPPVLSVTQLTQQLAGVLRTTFQEVWVSGEVSNYSRSSAGHAYLTLKDETSQIRAVIWRTVGGTIPFEVGDGLEVLAQGSIEVYAARGQYQLTVRQLIPKGIGPLELAFRQLRDKLEREGLFDPSRKRTIPRFPRRIALVTSPSGAAVRDFLEVAGRRWRGTEIIVVPSAVQGEAAIEQLSRALDRAGRIDGVEMIALVRGGGSLEDLASFNSEAVARAIHRAPVPVVSGVGHEIDLTIADLVADVRALTPSEAAERIFPDADKLEQELTLWTDRLAGSLQQRYERARLSLEALAQSRSLLFPLDRSQQWARQLDDAERSLVDSVRRRVDLARERWIGVAGPLDSLSPLKSLARGYALLTRDEEATLIRSIREVEVGRSLRMMLVDGTLRARVEEVTFNDDFPRE